MKLELSGAQWGERRRSEVTLGREDCAFRVDGSWYWQASGTDDLVGPFDTLWAAAANYERALQTTHNVELDVQDVIAFRLMFEQARDRAT